MCVFPKLGLRVVFLKYLSMEWISRRTSIRFILTSPWQHLCRRVANSYYKKWCDSVRYTLENILLGIWWGWGYSSPWSSERSNKKVSRTLIYWFTKLVWFPMWILLFLFISKSAHYVCIPILINKDDHRP